MNYFQIRTDLALEARESIQEADSSLQGVRVQEYEKENEDIHVTRFLLRPRMHPEPWERQ